mmetsp:Transcript_10255/g.62706  ORF Transcript_10255/g.62706 Transcript_10255/m.62706 type:complete len:224 (-) Transcript_10255:27-698(-)
MQHAFGFDASGVPGDVLERVREQRVACQDGDVFSVHLVVGGFSTSKVVVVHGRQVVVDQRHRVDHFHGACRRHCRFHVSIDQLARRQAQHRSDPLPTRQQRVAHGLVDELRTSFRHARRQGLLHFLRFLRHVRLELERRTCVQLALRRRHVRGLHLQLRRAWFASLRCGSGAHLRQGRGGTRPCGHGDGESDVAGRDANVRRVATHDAAIHVLDAELGRTADL